MRLKINNLCHYHGCQMAVVAGVCVCGGGCKVMSNGISDGGGNSPERISMGWSHLTNEGVSNCWA